MVATNATRLFVGFSSTYFMMSNAGGLALETHQAASPLECVTKCFEDPGCKAFDAGNTKAIDDGITDFQRGNCFRSYDSETSIKSRDVRSVAQLMLFKKIDTQHMKDVYFRKTVDGLIRGSDEGGSYHNEHSPEACAQLCLDDPSCKSFDAGRQVNTKLSATDKAWTPFIDNCFLSYKARKDVPVGQWVAPKCAVPAGGTTNTFDKECPNADSNMVDYYERIIPTFLSFDIA